MADITFSPVSSSDPLALTREQLKRIYKLTKGTTVPCEVVAHNPSPIVELYIDSLPPSKLATRHHIDEQGRVWLTEQCEVEDADYNWEPAPKKKRVKAPYLSDKFTIRDNPDPMWDQQFQYEEVKDLPINNVWTVVEGDSGKLWAITGFHIVNKLHYAVTEEPWTEEDESIDYKW